MIPMDAKGITWVGNIYQKFEAMCLEVEEGTIEYMENQVQTVGASVKKFYSDVMEDLFPPFAGDTYEIPFSDSPAVKYFDVDVCKTSPVKKVTPISFLKVNYENSEIQRKKKNSEVIAVVNKDAFDNGEHFHCISEELVISKNLEENLPRSSTTSESISTGRDACKALSSSEKLNESHEVNCPDAEKLSSVEVTRSDSLADSYVAIESDTKLMDSASVSSSHMAVFDKSQSEESMDTMLTSSSTKFPEEPNGSWGQKTCREPCSDLPELSDSWGLDALETEAVAETDKEAKLHVDKIKLEETCVIVCKADFQCVSLAGSNSRSYKKKIRQVFSSRKKSPRKQEYEELATLHGNSAKSNQVCAESRGRTFPVIDQKKSPHSEVCESEWELL